MDLTPLRQVQIVHLMDIALGEKGRAESSSYRLEFGDLARNRDEEREVKSMLRRVTYAVNVAIQLNGLSQWASDFSRNGPS